MDALRVRIRAAHLRTTLKSRHSVNSGVRAVLDALTDSELVQKADEHHWENLRFEQRKKTKEPDHRLTLLFREAVQRSGPEADDNDGHLIEVEDSTDTQLALLYKAALKSVARHPPQKPEIYSLQIDDVADSVEFVES